MKVDSHRALPMPPIFTVPEQPRRRTSDVLAGLALKCSEEAITLRRLVDGLGDRTYGIALIMLAAFNVIPFVSMFSGLLVTVVGLQMLLGLKRLYLPKRVLDYPLPALQVRATLESFSNKVTNLERFIRPRWQFTEAPIVDRINGFVLILLGVVIALPIPFANLVPALLVIVMAIGLLERDGVIQLLAVAVGLLLAALIVSISV